MADEKAGKKPDQEGGSGAEKDEAESAEAESAEAGGRHRRHRLLYTCWHDGAANYVHANWSWFTCWRCGSLNYM